MNSITIINNNLLKQKKSSIHKNEKKNIIISKKLLKINLINSLSKCENKIIMKFSFFKKKLKLKKINMNGKLFNCK